MKKNSFYKVLGIFLLMSICLHIALNSVPLLTSGASAPTKLQVHVGPPKVPADNKIYESIFVQLQDSGGKPARAPEDISVSLLSSDPDVGSVDPTVTIRKDDTYAVAKFYSTYTPGSTTITAVVSGLTSGQVAMTTVGPVPSKLAVYGFPPVLPTNGSFPGAIIIQLQDASELPAKAPIGGVSIALSSSETNIGNVTSTVTIPEGRTYTTTTFNTTLTPGSTTITAVASGYTTDQVTMTTQVPVVSPSKLEIYLGPPKVPAEGYIYNQSIAVQLQDASGKIASAVNDLNVTLSSSSLAIGLVDPWIIISNGSTYAATEFYSTYKSGSTTITAIASDYTTGQGSMITVGPIPEKLAAYCVPSPLPADAESYDAVFVQLQDSGGRPARDPIGDVIVTLSSSKTDVGNVSSSLVIPFRETHSVTRFNSTYTAGSTTITAAASGYTAGQAAMTTYLIDMFVLTVTVSANPDFINAGEQSTIRVYVAYAGRIAAPSATIRLTSDEGGSFSSVTDERNGYYTATFTAPSVSAQTALAVSANATKSGYISGRGQVQITVNPLAEMGGIHLYVKDAGNSSISGASVSSIAQPSGQSTLSGTTDSEGLVTFDNVLAGNYTLEVSKTGYGTKIKHITVNATQTTTDTIYLSAETSTSPVSPWVLIGIVAAGFIVVASVAWFYSSRKRRPRIPELTPSP